MNETKEDENIIKELFENVGRYEGFNHKSVRKILRKALKIKGNLNLFDYNKALADIEPIKEELLENTRLKRLCDISKLDKKLVISLGFLISYVKIEIDKTFKKIQELKKK